MQEKHRDWGVPDLHRTDTPARKTCRDSGPFTSPEAVRLANEKRGSLSLLPSESGDKQLDQPGSSSANEVVRKAPPRLRQPARGRHVLLAPEVEPIRRRVGTTQEGASEKSEINPWGFPKSL
jgi:hypothetical protein